MITINPYTLESAEVQETTNLPGIFNHAKASFADWSQSSVLLRLEKLSIVYDLFTKKSAQLAKLISLEVGKPIKQSKLEVERALEEFSYMLNNAEKFLEPEKVGDAEIHFAALGVIAVISPWNFPVMLPMRGIVPALLAGNTVIFKPSELSPQTGILIGQIFSEALEDSPLSLAVGGKDLGAKLVELPIAAIAFTGSTEVGKKIAKEAANSLKRLILELGGLDAAIVLADAEVEKSATEIVRTNARNSGQVCNSIKRVFVHESIYQEFVKHAVSASKQLCYGDPLDEKTDLGPLVSSAQYERVKSFLEDAVSKGAKASSVEITKKGFMFPQTILSDVSVGAKLLQEEPFGPLLPIMKFSSEQEAIELANNTKFGLTTSVWTKDREKARKIAEKLDVGMVRHNTHLAMASGIPWGGAKESGVGRMKTKEGLREFCNVKVVA